MTKTLHINLLGAPSVTIDNQPITNFVSNKARALFYYLAAHPIEHERAKLATFLWGGNPKAKRNLRDVIYNLRQSFDPFLTISRTKISLNLTENVHIDYQQFSTLLDQRIKDLEEWRQLLSLYRGELLEGFWLDEQLEYDEWQSITREQVEMRFTEALETAVGYFFSQQDS